MDFRAWTMKITDYLSLIDHIDEREIIISD